MDNRRIGKYYSWTDYQPSAFWFDGQSVLLNIDKFIKNLPRPIGIDKKKLREHLSQGTNMTGYCTTTSIANNIDSLWIGGDSRLEHGFGRIKKDFDTISARYNITNYSKVYLFHNFHRLIITYRDEPLRAQSAVEGLYYYDKYSVDFDDVVLRHYSFRSQYDIYSFIDELKKEFHRAGLTLENFHDELFPLDNEKFEMMTADAQDKMTPGTGPDKITSGRDLFELARRTIAETARSYKIGWMIEMQKKKHG